MRCRLVETFTFDLGVRYASCERSFTRKAKLHLEIRFEDGGVQSATIDAEVALPNQRPEKFMVARGGGNKRTTGTIYMDLSALSNHVELGPMAVYAGHEN